MYGAGKNGQFNITKMLQIVRRGLQNANKLDSWAVGTKPANVTLWN